MKIDMLQNSHFGKWGKMVREFAVTMARTLRWIDFDAHKKVYVPLVENPQKSLDQKLFPGEDILEYYSLPKDVRCKLIKYGFMQVKYQIELTPEGKEIISHSRGKIANKNELCDYILHSLLEKQLLFARYPKTVSYLIQAMQVRNVKRGIYRLPLKSKFGRNWVDCLF
eukprot:UN30777